MKIESIARFAFIFALLPFSLSLPALAQGNSVLAQVADGTGSDGTQFITKLRITNLAPPTSGFNIQINNLKVSFYHQNGSPWAVATDIGTASDFSLVLGEYQTLAINTLGSGSDVTSGYVIVRNTGQTYTDSTGTQKTIDSDIYSEDFQISITAFYEVRRGGNVIDTISVPISKPTISFSLPVENDSTKELFTGFAIVNLSDTSNSVTLQLFQTTNPTSGVAQSAGTQTISLNAGEQRAVFLYPALFPNAGDFKGMLLGNSSKAIAILALLQTPTQTGVQYATMVPAYLDALRRNTYMYLRLGYPLDADLPGVDYWANADESSPWDLLFDEQTDFARRLAPQQGAAVAVIGPKLDTDFDALPLQYIQGLTYSSNPIDMSNTSTNLASQFAFAIKTGLGRYAKIRIADVISRWVSLFQIDSTSALISSLNQGVIPSTVKDAFAAFDRFNLSLSSGAYVSIQQSGASWLITDGQHQYSLDLSDSKIYVSYPGYDLALEVYVFK